MKKELLLILLIALVIVISGCATEVTNEEILTATQDLNNITDQELQEELSNRDESIVGKAIRRAVQRRSLKESEGNLIISKTSKEVQKVTSKYSTPIIQAILESRKNYVYEIKLDPNNGNIIGIRFFEQEDEAKVLVENYTKLRDQAQQRTRKKLQLKVDGKAVTAYFNRYNIMIVEDFSQENITLVEYKDDLPLNEILVRVPTGISLTGKSFSVKIFDEQSNEESFNKYLIKEGNLEGNIAGLASRQIKKSYLYKESDTNQYELVLEYHEAFYEAPSTCDKLKEVIPGHNKIEENRINIIFQGGGYFVEGPLSWGIFEYLSALNYLIDINGEGLTLEVPMGIPPSIVELQINGLFGEKPFIGNGELFNFWYSEEDGSRVPEGRGDPYNTCSTYLPEDFSWEIEPNCNLPNKINIHLINKECRSTASFEGSMGLSMRSEVGGLNAIKVFVHEMGHAFGQLADEYTEEEFGNQWMYPNCASDLETALSWGWFPLLIHRGCAYVEENYRATSNSIMRYHSVGSHFDYVNENHLCFRMAELTGRVCEIVDGSFVLEDPLNLLPNCPEIETEFELYHQDFEYGKAEEWNLGDGWTLYEEDYSIMLKGQDHNFANFNTEHNWDNYVFETMIKPKKGAININFRSNNNGRYFINFNLNNVGLHRQYNGWDDGTIFEELAHYDGFFSTDWHHLKITVEDNLIIICIDGKKVFEVEDPTHSQGDISFETLEDSTFYVDDIIVKQI